MVTAITFPLLLGVVGLASEAGMWLTVERSMQGAADAAAYSAAVAAYEGAGPAEVCQEALAAAARSGYPSADASCKAAAASCAEQTCLKVNFPPAKGGYTATPAAVEVIVEQQQPATILGFINAIYRLPKASVGLAARAVAAAALPGDCALALDTNTAFEGLSSDGSSDAALNCGFAANASLKLNGGATIAATSGAVGGTVDAGNGSLTPATPARLTVPVADPYADNIPSDACAGCAAKCGSGTTLSSDQAVPAGVYCCGLKLTAPSDPNKKVAVSSAANSGTAAGGTTLQFANGVNQVQTGWLADDWTTLTAIPGGTTVTAIGGSSKSFTLSGGVDAPGVAAGDTIEFTAAAPTSAAAAPGATALTFAGPPLGTINSNSPSTLTAIDVSNPGAIPAGTTVSLAQAKNAATVTLSQAVLASDAAGHGVLGGDIIAFVLSASYTMSGTYTICGGSFAVEGGANVTGNPVTVLLTGNGNTGYASLEVAGGSAVTMTAPSAGSYAGLVFYQDPGAGAAATPQSRILGGASTVITGALDFGATGLLYNGTSSAATPCTQIIGWDIEFHGNSSIGDQCSGTGVRPVGAVALVE